MPSDRDQDELRSARQGQANAAFTHDIHAPAIQALRGGFWIHHRAAARSAPSTNLDARAKFRWAEKLCYNNG